MGTRRIRRHDGDFTLFFRKVSPFSNHHPADFDCDESINFKETKRFSCTEQYYMYNKASLIRDRKLMEDVLKSDNPKEMKMMCSKGSIRSWNDSTWDENKESVMYIGSTAKFRASKSLRFALFLTTGSQLVECSPFDRIWGIGKDLETAETSSLRSGQNLLGKILDRVREELWKDNIYQDERHFIEDRMKNDSDYLKKAMKHIDLMYKGRATQRYLMSNGHIYRDDQSYVSADVSALIPEWAVPPRLEKNEPIRASPPQITNFPTTPPLRRSPSFSPPVGVGRLAGRISYGERRPERVERRRRSRSRSRNRRDRSRSRSRSRRDKRDKSRSRSRRSRSRDGRRNRNSPVVSGRRVYIPERTSERRRNRSNSREHQKRSDGRRSGSNDKDRRRRSRSNSRNRSGRERKRRHSSRSNSPTERKRSREEEKEEKKRYKRKQLRAKNARELARSREDRLSDPKRRPRSESDEDCHRTLKKMKKLLKKQIKEKKKRALKPPSSTSSESEAENQGGPGTESPNGSSTSS